MYFRLQTISSFLFAEYNIPRGVPPGLPVVRSVRDVSLLPDDDARTRLQPVQHRGDLRITAARHRYIIQPYRVSDTQENQGE